MFIQVHESENRNHLDCPLLQQNRVPLCHFHLQYHHAISHFHHLEGDPHDLACLLLHSCIVPEHLSTDSLCHLD